MTRTCRNKYCLELVPNSEGWALCPSCRYIGRWCFWLGAILAGAVVKLLPLVIAHLTSN